LRLVALLLVDLFLTENERNKDEPAWMPISVSTMRNASVLKCHHCTIGPQTALTPIAIVSGRSTKDIVVT